MFIQGKDKCWEIKVSRHREHYTLYELKKNGKCKQSNIRYFPNIIYLGEYLAEHELKEVIAETVEFSQNLIEDFADKMKFIKLNTSLQRVK